MTVPDLTDDKHTKFARSAETLSSLSLRNIASKDSAALLQSTVQCYTVFLMAGSVLFYLLGGSLSHTTIDDKIGYVSTIVEGLGLVSLTSKISKQGSVKGISGMTMAMFALTYTLREAEMLIVAPLSVYSLNGWTVEILQIVSLLITYNVLRSVFSVYRSSYQDDLDVCHIQHLIPGCMIAAAVIHPTFQQGLLYTYCWTASFYIDVMALLPQVVMMAKGKGTVEAPVAHFVAATAFSRSVDLFYWYFRFDLGPQGYWFGVNYSGWVIVFFHVVNLALVADFMYYYMKARFSGSKFSADLSIPTECSEV